MKKALAFIALLTILLSFNACKKSGGSSNNTNGIICTTSPYKIGSVATYGNSSGSYTVTINGNSTYNGKNYFTGITTSGSSTVTGYIYLDPNNGDEWQMLPATGDLPQQEMIYCKPSQAVGSTWSYTFQSVTMPGIVTYKYTFAIAKQGVSFTLGNTTNTNCTQSHCIVETFYNGALMGSGTADYTFACGWGLVQTLQNGSVYSTLTALKY